MHRILATLLILPLLQAASAEAQLSLAPLVPSLDSMRMVLVRPSDERDMGMLYDEVSLVDGAEGKQLRRVYRLGG